MKCVICQAVDEKWNKKKNSEEWGWKERAGWEHGILDGVVRTVCSDKMIYLEGKFYKLGKDFKNYRDIYFDSRVKEMSVSSPILQALSYMTWVDKWVSLWWHYSSTNLL